MKSCAPLSTVLVEDHIRLDESNIDAAMDMQSNSGQSRNQDVRIQTSLDDTQQ